MMSEIRRLFHRRIVVARQTRRIVPGMAAILLLASTSRAIAQGDTVKGHGNIATPPELVFSASRYAQEAREAPASVTIITADEIREFGYRTLADVLGSVRGFSTRYDFNYDYTTVRGLARLGDFNTRILVLVDGQRINATVSDISNIGTDALIDLERVHHIEVIRGPGSAQFGTNAFFGVVNIVTGRAAGDPARGQASVHAGSLGTIGGSLAWGTSTSAATRFSIAGSAERQAGKDRFYPEFVVPGVSDGVAQGLDGEESWHLLSKARHGDWSFEGAFAYRRRSVPTASYETDFNTKPQQTYDRSGMANLTYSHGFADLSRLTLTGAATYTNYDGDYPYAGINLDDFQKGRVWSFDAQYLRVVGAGHKVTVGTDLRWSDNGSQGAKYEAVGQPDSLIFNDVRSQLIGAVFGQVEWHLGDHALLTTGIRRDEYQHTGGTTNPRAALVLRPDEETTIKALYGRAFRSPNLYELYYRDGVTQKVPDGLVPEHITSAELEIEHRFGGITATVSGYHITTSDLINLTTDPSDSLLVYANQGSPHARGLEFELRGRLGPFTGRASYTIQDAREDDGTRMVDSPTRQARVGVAVPLLDRHLNAAIEVRHVGARPTLAGVDAPAYTVTNLTILVHPLRQQLELTLGVKDVFNVGHLDPGGEELRQNVLAQDGRSIRIGLRRTF